MEVIEKIKTFFSLYKKIIIVLLIIIVIIIYFFINKDRKQETVIYSEESISLKQAEASEQPIKEEYIYVDVKGEIKNAGVYKLKKDSRVIDALEQAVLLKTSNTRFINLSKKLTDEMVIIVYSNDEIKTYFKSKIETNLCDLLINDACIENKDGISSIINDEKENSSSYNLNPKEKEETPKENTENKIININTATKEELMTLNGIGESKAISIIEYRTTNGLFADIQSIMNVSGIGQSTFDKFKNQITV